MSETRSPAAAGEENQDPMDGYVLDLSTVARSWGQSTYLYRVGEGEGWGTYTNTNKKSES